MFSHIEILVTTSTGNATHWSASHRAKTISESKHTACKKEM
jgi:hypothetical protein